MSRLRAEAERRGEAGLRRGLPGLLVGAVMVLGLVLAPGAGAVSYAPGTPFAIGSQASGIAVDNGSGDVYVSQFFGAGFTAGTVFHYGSTGTVGTPATIGTGFNADVGVNQSTDEIAVLGGESFGLEFKVSTFEANGTPTGTPFSVGFSSSTVNFSIDSSGNSYVSNTASDTVQKYDSAGVLQATVFECPDPACDATPMNNPGDLAIDTAGNVYVVDAGNDRVIEFDSAGTYVKTWQSGKGAVAVAVDSSTGNVFVAELPTGGEFQVTAYDSTGAVIGEFAKGLAGKGPIVGLTPTIAVNEATGTIYVTDPATDLALPFVEVLPPEATTQAATGIGATTATLNASVDPNGQETTECLFEYTTKAKFEAEEFTGASLKGCAPSPGESEVPVAVSTSASGLSATTTYVYRVAITTAGGSAGGDPVEFTTLAEKPKATTEAATGIAQTVATLNGKVDAEGDDASCVFQYGTTTAYGDTAPCSVDPVTGTTPTAVSAAISGLTPNTTYHYRVVAENAGGTTNGADMTLTTLADTCETNQALCPPPPPPPPPAGGGDTGSTPPPTGQTPPPTAKKTKKKPLKCKKGFKKKKVKGKQKCVKVKKKSKKKR